MEALVLVGATASIAQLIQLFMKTSSSVIKLVEEVGYAPEEFRRLQLTIRSMRAKLQALENLLSNLPGEIHLPVNLRQEFRDCLLELQGDFQLVIDSAKVFTQKNRRIWSLREKLHYRAFHRKTLVKSIWNLLASEKNLQRVESLIYLFAHNSEFETRRANHIHLSHIAINTNNNTTVARAITHDQPCTQTPSATYMIKHQSRKWRAPLFNLNSYWRKLGFYGLLVNEDCHGDIGIQTTICFGLYIHFWLILVSIALELSFASAPSLTAWSFRWNLRIQNRVATDSALMSACRCGDILLIQRILKEGGGSVSDRTSRSGRTPLLTAISGRHLQAIEYLLHNGADPNLADDDQNRTPLFAVAGMDLQKSQYLEQYPSTWDSWLETFRLLIKHGASVSDIVRGRTLASLNVSGTSKLSTTLEYLQLLAAEDSIQLDVVAGKECWSALQNALRSDYYAVDCLKLLRSAGVDLTKIMSDGRTALHLASEWCLNSEPLQYLCSTDCHQFINKQDQWGWTPLHYASIARNSAVSCTPFSKAIMLVRSGAMINIKGSNNPRNHYNQPVGIFTAFELLKLARPLRFDILVNSFVAANVKVESRLAGDLQNLDLSLV